MPGWHDSTQKLQDDGTLQMVGIIQEQHPERTRLFMQWKQMGWPIMVDSLNLLEVEVVPITLLIDEAGIIRFRGRPEHLDDFLALPSPDPMPHPSTAVASIPIPPSEFDPVALRHYADQTFLWDGDLDAAIAAYLESLAADADQGITHFRLGVAYRRRADSPQRQNGDFRRAVDHWGRAVDIDPNQYIWRRRIQQYGPRLEKPYAFYDWVTTAREEIAARGETPITLPVEPRGAEIALPSKAFEGQGSAVDAPPRNAERIRRDQEGMVLVETTVVPRTIAPGASARVHLTFRPNGAIKAHWNNEAKDMVVWLAPPDGWGIDQRRSTVANPPELVSDEDRVVEVELRRPDDPNPGGTTDDVALTGYALYYVCEDIDGTCLYRRQDLSVPLRLDQKP